MPEQFKTAADVLSKSTAPPDASEKLAEELNKSIFKIVTDTSLSGPGTGWRAPDGRIVTDFDAIKGASEIFAEQDGKRYKIGKTIKIDDINNLAVLDFVDKPPDTPCLSLRKAVPVPGEKIFAPRYNRGTFEVEHGSFTRAILQSEYRSAGGWPLSRETQFDSRELGDALDFAKRPLYESTVWLCVHGNGGPILSADNQVLGSLTMSNGKHSYAVPRQKIDELLAQKEGDEKFKIQTGYENGFQKYWNNLSRCPQSAIWDTANVGHGALAIAAMKYGPREAKIAGSALLGVFSAMRLFEDYSAYSGQTNNLDRKKFGLALVADTATTAGLGLFAAGLRYTPLRAVGLGLAVAGMAGRLATEIVPNHFVIQDIKRTDGDPRPPFSRF